MTTWQYFLGGDHPELADEGQAELIRLPTGAPVSLAESVRRSGRWEPTDTMWNERYKGSWDATTEISAERADQILNRWVEHGLIPGMPDPRSSIPPDMAQRLVDAARRADTTWQGVPTPPGALDIKEPD
jgi:hypothetical protein